MAIAMKPMIYGFGAHNLMLTNVNIKSFMYAYITNELSAKWACLIRPFSGHRFEQIS